MPVIIVLVAIVVVVLLWMIAAYNGLVGKRVRAQEAWSQIDVQLKRRYDLIPNLVETVKGYAAHEKGTLEAVIQARNSAMAVGGDNVAQKAQAENVLSGALRQLFALSEAYPNLKANENFARLQEELHRHGKPHRLRAAVLQRRRSRCTTPPARPSPATSSPGCSSSRHASSSRSRHRPNARRPK